MGEEYPNWANRGPSTPSIQGDLWQCPACGAGERENPNNGFVRGMFHPAGAPYSCRDWDDPYADGHRHKSCVPCGYEWGERISTSPPWDSPPLIS